MWRHKNSNFWNYGIVSMFRQKKTNKVPLPKIRLLVTIAGFHLTSLKFETKKISILPRFYFHDALEQLKTNFHANFGFKSVLGFVIEYAWISKLLRDAEFTWRPRGLSCRLKKWLISGHFASFHFPDSGLYLLNGFDFYFDLLWKPAIGGEI